MVPVLARYCLKCDYPLADASAAVCPECGRAFDPADPRTFAAKPGFRRRLWIRRIVYVIGVLALVELFAPSRIAKLTWSWPNPDGVTATSETRWCLIAPAWLPVRYPRWSMPRTTKPIESGGLILHRSAFWRVGVASVYADGGGWVRMPLGPGPSMVGWFGPPDGGAASGLDIVPQNVDKLCDWVLEAPAPSMTFSRHIISPSAPAGPDGKSGEP